MAELSMGPWSPAPRAGIAGHCLCQEGELRPHSPGRGGICVGALAPLCCRLLSLPLPPTPRPPFILWDMTAGFSSSWHGRREQTGVRGRLRRDGAPARLLLGSIMTEVGHRSSPAMLCSVHGWEPPKATPLVAGSLNLLSSDPSWCPPSPRGNRALSCSLPGLPQPSTAAPCKRRAAWGVLAAAIGLLYRLSPEGNRSYQDRTTSQIQPWFQHAPVSSAPHNL